MYSSITAAELALRLQKEKKLILLDVREPYEFDQLHIPGAHLIPLGELEEHVSELAARREQEVIVYCKAGVRSAVACRILAGHGFQYLVNLSDGILGWAALVKN